VSFDGVVERIAAAAVDVAEPESKVHLRRASSFGILPADIDTPLAMVLNELLLNAVEHGFAGRAADGDDLGEVVISAHRFRRQLHVAVAATGMSTAEESRLFRFTIKHSVLLMICMAIISMLFAYVFPHLVPMP
jgi:two-component sensor histidine kinase